MLTPADLRNPALKSGFNYVRGGQDARTASGHGGGLPFQAQHGPQRRPVGPRRATGEEAAQDYCDYVNNGYAAPVVTLRSAGHQRPRRRKPSRRNSRRPRSRASALDKPGYVYCIGEEGGRTAVKIGFTDDARYRIGSLQTGNPRRLVILGVIKGTQRDERELHAEYINQNILGEWFRPSEELLSEFDIDPEGVLA